MQPSPSVTPSLAAAPSCVVGTLPPSLLAAIAEPSRHISAHLAATRPSTIEAASSDVDSTGEVRYAVFDDAVARHRWTVEVQGSTAAEAWRLGGAMASQPISGARYIMQQDTWREVAIEAAAAPSLPVASPLTPPTASATATPAVTAAVVVECSPDVAQAAKSEPERGVASEAPTRTSAGPAAGSSSPAAPSEAVAPPTASTHDTATLQERLPATATATTSPGVISNLKGLSMQDLANEHNALARLLVQTLAPQRMPVALVVRHVCTASSAAGGGDSAAPTCDLHDAAGDPVRYSEAAVVTAVEQLTHPHPRQPKQRELKSEAYLLMNVGGFADGELRHKAVNRAYPALAHHWPASAPLLDAMERYADREVVLETRKRHPELMAPENRKRQRSYSHSREASVSSAEGEEESVAAPTTVAAAESHSNASAGALPAPRRFVFQALQECPQSLERGDLHAWRTGAEAAGVREALQAAITLTHQDPFPSATVATSAASASPSTALSPSPITTESDEAVLRGRYDALAAAEEALERQLRDYRDTVHELRKWYREDQCAPQFREELAAWVHAQEEARTALVTLCEQVHAVRYTLERDLSDYLHLHALRVF